ncbi:tRNA (adenosine(37)-N6)-threonylcarbamoyltransferase complex dimerization subunit type 1 TsaB [Listeria sp. PSOL-1]|uniref:tRNA (adenosine(37)-N6)-threonylcarbamoyltransferase complex dimerization subunit type 1 TsaB n=1 Tax=Listeria sp. PSOL-1 TaxID=1844999 RepID=UPI0013D37C36|nr:tRNA (adenosine(37)-N6)-threonylcarbamoyltransferase complex dimerization subunit type 1 TsaB [Listeria sp. PSOL-1]
MILGIDTATDIMAVSLYHQEKVLGEYTTNLKKNHSIRLLPAIDMLMKECQVKIADLEKIAVAEGPGSYTGLRIGVSTAKTLAWDLGIPLVGVSSLEIIASPGLFFSGKIVPLIDARRDNVYAGVYETADNELITVKKDQHMALDDLLQSLPQNGDKYLFIGDISSSFHEKIQGHFGQHAEFAMAENISRAGYLARVAETRQKADVHSFVPKYLKLAEAESKWLEAGHEK